MYQFAEASVCRRVDAESYVNSSYNYAYDEEGRLIKDVQEGIDKITWAPTGKVKGIRRPDNSTRPSIEFTYDPMGNRIKSYKKQ